jgi:hypothetical protein
MSPVQRPHRTFVCIFVLGIFMPSLLNENGFAKRAGSPISVTSGIFNGRRNGFGRFGQGVRINTFFLEMSVGRRIEDVLAKETCRLKES